MKLRTFWMVYDIVVSPSKQCGFIFDTKGGAERFFQSNSKKEPGKYSPPEVRKYKMSGNSEKRMRGKS